MKNMLSIKGLSQGQLETNNIKPVYLLAGGRPKNPKTSDPLIQAVFRETGKTSPTIAYVGTASKDNKIFFHYIAHIFRKGGAGKVEHALIASREANLQRARDILEAADIIFISGGDVEIGMRVLEEKNMTDFLFQLYEKGRLFFGASAGSIMLAKEWVRWRDSSDDSTAELFPCLGFASIICDTHAEEDNWEELKAALRLGKDGMKGYGIPSRTAIKVYPDGNIEALGGAVYRYVRHGNRVDRDDL